MLSCDEISQYKNDGYVIPDYRIPGDTLEFIKQRHSQFITEHPEYSDYCPGILPWVPEFIEVAKNTVILDMVSQLIGNDIALWNSSFFAKPPLVGSKTPWHQDGQYWAMRPLATCTVWIAVDDSTVENGCLKVIRGSHYQRSLMEHEMNHDQGLALNQEISDSEIDQAKIDCLELKAGQISLHDVYLVHGSDANHSTEPRRGMTLRFMPTTSHYDRNIEHKLLQSPDNMERRRRPLPIYLMRGIDRCGLNDFYDVCS